MADVKVTLTAHDQGLKDGLKRAKGDVDKFAMARGARQRPLKPAPATLSRSAFGQLTARQKSAHCLGGGKLTN